MDENPKIKVWLENLDLLDSLSDTEPKEVVDVTSLIHQSKIYRKPYIRLLPFMIKAHLKQGNHFYATLLFTSCPSMNKFYNTFYDHFYQDVIGGLLGSPKFYKGTFPKNRQLFILRDASLMDLFAEKSSPQTQPFNNTVVEQFVWNADVCPKTGWDSTDSVHNTESIVRVSVLLFELLLAKKYPVDCIEILETMHTSRLVELDTWKYEIEKRQGDAYYHEILKFSENSPARLLLMHAGTLPMPTYEQRMSLYIYMLDQFLKKWPTIDTTKDILNYTLWTTPVILRYLKNRKTRYLSIIITRKLEERRLSDILTLDVQFPPAEVWAILRKYIGYGLNGNQGSSAQATARILNLFQSTYQNPKMMFILTGNLKEIRPHIVQMDFDTSYFKKLLFSIFMHNSYPKELVDIWRGILLEMEALQSSRKRQPLSGKRKLSARAKMDQSYHESQRNRAALLHDGGFDSTRSLTVHKIPRSEFQPIIMNSSIPLSEIQTRTGFAS